MKHSLQLRLSQHLTLTPQLQQSIRLLQLSTIELNQEVDRLLQENPLLERADAEEEGARPEEVPLAGPNRVGEAGASSTSSESSETPEAEARNSRDDAPDIADFADYGSSGGGGSDSDWGGGSNNEDDDFYPQQVATDSLRDHLNAQLRTTSLELRDRQIVGALIDALDDDGYLPSSLEEIADMFPAELEIAVDDLERIGAMRRVGGKHLQLQREAFGAIARAYTRRIEALHVLEGDRQLLEIDFELFRKELGDLF